jgi:hypothetical protein
MSDEKKIDDGGPAFPVPMAATPGPNGEHHLYDATERCLGGMTLRDYFAGQALQGMLARMVDVKYAQAIREEATSDQIGVSAALSIMAYAKADAMLAARKQHHTG